MKTRASRGLGKFVTAFAMSAAVGIGSSPSVDAAQITIHGNADPNLQATIDIISLTNGAITFSAANVVVSGVTSSITGIGFAIPEQNVTANTPAACGPTLAECGNFGLNPVVSNSPGNVPQFPATTMDWALLTGPLFTGGNPPGINQGLTATFVVTGNLAGLTQQQFLAGVYVRFQSVVDPAFPTVGSDVAHAVPEPASLFLLGSALLGARLLRRRGR